MGLRKLLGWALVSLPFIGVLSLIGYAGGLALVLSIIFSTAFLAGCIILGIELIERG